MTDTKPCEVCGATITRTKQGATDWARRSYCSRTCTAAARRKPDPELTRDCQHCGTVMHRPADARRWLARYCSDKCRAARRGPARKPNLPRCEICSTALKPRKTPLPWCSKTCKAAWLAVHIADVMQRPARAQRYSAEDTQPPVRLRSELLPADTPRKTWVDRTPGHVAVCCGHCRRRFPRGTIRLAERLLTLHRRACGSGL